MVQEVHRKQFESDILMDASSLCFWFYKCRPIKMPTNTKLVTELHSVDAPHLVTLLLMLQFYSYVCGGGHYALRKKRMANSKANMNKRTHAWDRGCHHPLHFSIGRQWGPDSSLSVNNLSNWKSLHFYWQILYFYE